VIRKILEEHAVEGKRLGRHIEHDPRSRDYAYEVFVKAADLHAVEHVRRGDILNQRHLGSCVGNAAAGAKNTEPLYDGDDHILHEDGAVDIYSLATRLDGLSDGYYPPDDTGSSGLAAAKAMKQQGMIGSYQHAFGIDAALSALQVGPVITGVGWYQGFDTPNADGLVKIAGQIRGGHELVARGYQPAPNPDDALIKLDNSWGPAFGVNGSFYWTVAIWKRLLAEQGDVTILVT
jgi:hypothetical protein